jgi:hypothetical protein
MNKIIEILVLTFATTAILRAWFRGSIFARWRAKLQARGGLLGQLFKCSLCLSFHVAFWLKLILPQTLPTNSQQFLDCSGLFFIEWLAVVGLVNILEEIWPTNLE